MTNTTDGGPCGCGLRRSGNFQQKSSRNCKAIDGNIINGVAQFLPSRLRRGQFHGVYQCMGVEESTGWGGD